MRLVDRIGTIFQVICQIALAILLLMVTQEVFRRYIMGSPTQYTLEYSEILIVLITFLSTGWVMRERNHVSVTFLAEMLSPRTVMRLEIFGLLLLLLFCLIVVWFGGEIAAKYLENGARESSLVATPLWIPHSLIPLGFFVLALQVVSEIIMNISRLRDGSPLDQNGD
ncbi:MAG: TRAP transporter small permease [Hoeflea sp. D1-CHI-28]